MKPNMIAIISDDARYARRAVVWGIGRTLGAALADACARRPGEPDPFPFDTATGDSDGWAGVDVGPDVVASFKKGIIHCDNLGIQVVYHDGKVSGAFIAPPGLPR